MFKLDNVSMVDRAVDLDFAHKLLFGPALAQRSFLNDLPCEDNFVLLVYHLVTLGEPSLPQKLTPHVLLNLDVPIVLNYLLLHQHLLILFHILIFFNSI